MFINSTIAKELKEILSKYNYIDSNNMWKGNSQSKNELAIAYYILKQPEYGFQLIKAGDKKESNHCILQRIRFDY
jgi:hypothetical protein